MARQNMRPVTEIMPIYRHELDAETPGLVAPYNVPATSADPLFLFDGEFVTFNGQNKWNREGMGNAATGGDPTLNPNQVGAAARVPCFPVWSERGRTDMQALGKIPVFFNTPVLADFHRDVLRTGDAFEVGSKLYVNWLSDGADRNRRRGLTVENGGDPLAVVHGIVTRVYQNSADGFLIQALLVVPAV